MISYLTVILGWRADHGSIIWGTSGEQCGRAVVSKLLRHEKQLDELQYNKLTAMSPLTVINDGL